MDRWICGENKFHEEFSRFGISVHDCVRRGTEGLGIFGARSDRRRDGRRLIAVSFIDTEFACYRLAFAPLYV